MEDLVCQLNGVWNLYMYLSYQISTMPLKITNSTRNKNKLKNQMLYLKTPQMTTMARVVVIVQAVSVAITLIPGNKL